MKLLAIDTSSQACSIALQLGEKTISQHIIAPMQQAQMLLPEISKLLQSEKIELNHIDAIVFGCGPGSFTGIRIAISAAQGLAYAANLPLISISSLAALAQAAFMELSWKKLLVAVDARVQEVYCGAYEVQKDGLVSLIGEERVCAPEAVVAPNESTWNGVGNAWDIYTDKMSFIPSVRTADPLPTALAMLALAKPKYINQDYTSAKDAIPVYLRDNVARKKA